MCGISGIIGDIKNKDKFVFLSKKFLKRRGPDNFSYKFNIDKRSLICHSRLSLIDINSRSNQPFLSKCGNYLLTYNGELYNYKDIRYELIKCGFKFDTNSDTEVFLYGLIYFGIEKFLSEKVEGMFAFAMHDLSKNILWLARDIHGQKPLCYSIDQSKFLFASDSRIISNYLNYKNINLDSINGFLCYGYIPSKNGFYKNIFDLFPGYIYKYDINSKGLDQFSFKEKNSYFLNTQYDSYKDFKEKLIFSVSDVFEADVDVGIFLSSGLDSSLIALISKYILKKDPICFSIGSGLKKDEADDIRKFCKENSLRSFLFNIEPKRLAEEYLKYPDIYDRPMSDTSCALISFLSNRASKYTRCVLSGDGADELFWGYPRYKKYFLLDKFNQIIFSNYLVNKFTIGTKLWKLIYKGPVEGFYRISNVSNGILSFNDSYRSWEQIVDGDLYEYLPQNCLVKSDRASMFSSLEIRSPFLSKGMSNCSRNMNIKTKFNISKNKLFHRNFFEELSGKKYEINSKRGFSASTDTIYKFFPKEYISNVNRSVEFLGENGYESRLINKLIKNKIIEWRLFSLGLYLNKI